MSHSSSLFLSLSLFAHSYNFWNMVCIFTSGLMWSTRCLCVWVIQAKTDWERPNRTRRKTIHGDLLIHKWIGYTNAMMRNHFLSPNVFVFLYLHRGHLYGQRSTAHRRNSVAHILLNCAATRKKVFVISAAQQHTKTIHSPWTGRVRLVPCCPQPRPLICVSFYSMANSQPTERFA